MSRKTDHGPAHALKTRWVVRASLLDRLMAKAMPEPNCGCWLWTAMVDKKGYGRINVNKIPEMAHRMMWVAHHGPIPAGRFICHRCDMPSCINPEHMFLGSLNDNNQDMIRKGRAGFQRHPEQYARLMRERTDYLRPLALAARRAKR